MPIIKGFRATTITHSFILNALVATITIMVAVTVKDKLESTYKDSHGVVHKFRRHFTLKEVAITASITFVATILSFSIMYVLFGYGCGQLCD